MALLQAAVDFDAYEIVLRDKPPEMLALSPKGTVPVLALPNGSVIEQSLDIMRWALEPQDALGWWASSQTPSNLALLALNDGEFKQHLDRYKYPEKFERKPSGFHRDAATAGLIDPLEQRLATQLYLGGDKPSAVDLAIFPFIRQFRAVDVVWFDAQTIPATQLWLQRWLASALFAGCMKKLPVNTRAPF